jgi:hypothetical protein
MGSSRHDRERHVLEAGGGCAGRHEPSSDDEKRAVDTSAAASQVSVRWEQPLERDALEREQTRAVGQSQLGRDVQ